MKCEKCGLNFSNSVYNIHVKRCGVKEVKEKEFINYTVSELKEMCKQKGLKGYSKLNESELIALLEGE